MNFEYMLEVIAVISFAVFGANAAIQHKLDVFGVIVMASTTTVGGGLIRDLILNVKVPVMFATPMYCMVSALTGIVVILITNYMRMQRVKKQFDIKRTMEVKAKFDYIVTLCDAIGMGFFAISGVNMSVACGHGDNIFMTVFIGVISGVGGGLLRDIMINRQPMIFKKEIYATAALIGVLIYYFIMPYMDKVFAIYLCTGIIAFIRMYTMKHNVNLFTQLFGSRIK